ncbi:L,D-transpeptidase family protein [Candidatus Bealeia paramacronuclearis]|uniref:L,D-transpeptidase family protein n=1 Tax=Candidatus Bealeia paramacronuclearis TaxID=1921001 RepID=A0ABZ2C211_9PROT|nr:L,D-transpeptidase family protein [Candidatus Bealeia paramacronuclearis]
MKNLIVKGTQAIWGNATFSIVHGCGGITKNKSEGDGSTPVGTFPFRCVFYRKDRIPEIETDLPLHILEKEDGWCDDVNDPLYNRYVKLPYSGRHEDLWREDRLYDIIVVMGYNDDPVVPYKGSAIFVHLKPLAGKSTAGCIGLEKEVLVKVLKEATLESCLIVEAPLGA